MGLGRQLAVQLGLYLEQSSTQQVLDIIWLGISNRDVLCAMSCKEASMELSSRVYGCTHASESLDMHAGRLTRMHTLHMRICRVEPSV